MITFTVNSYQEPETKQWAPSGTLFKPTNDNKMSIQEADIFPPEFRFDTKEKADEFIRNYFSEKGYVEKISQ